MTPEGPRNPMWGDLLTPAEIARMEVVLGELESAGVAQGLLRNIHSRGGVSLAAQPEMFEARIAHELMLQGVPFEYEHPTGVHGDSVDIYLPGPPNVHIEVASLRTSLGVQEAMWQEGNMFGVALSSANLIDGGGDPRASIEHDLMVFQRKLGEKVYGTGRERKFPVPDEDTLNILVMDLRGLYGGLEAMSAVYIEVHCAVYGVAPVNQSTGMREPCGLVAPDGKRLIGVFEDVDQHPLTAARYLRERIHALHLVYETEFVPGELTSPGASVLFVNPNLVLNQEDYDALIASYPLYRPSGYHEPSK